MKKEIKGFPGYYVSRDGKVYGKNGAIKPQNNKRGYTHVLLCRDGKRYTKTIHRLIANAFVDNPKNKPQVNHKNGDKKDNRAGNLEWVTPKENSVHAMKAGKMKTKLTHEQVNEIRLIAKNHTRRELAKMYSCSHGHITQIVNLKRRQWAGDI